MKSFDSKTSPALVAFGPPGADGLPGEGADGSPETAGSVRVDAQPATASSAAAIMTGAIHKGCRRAADVPIAAVHHLRAIREILGSRPQGRRLRGRSPKGWPTSRPKFYRDLPRNGNIDATRRSPGKFRDSWRDSAKRAAHDRAVCPMGQADRAPDPFAGLSRRATVDPDRVTHSGRGPYSGADVRLRPRMHRKRPRRPAGSRPVGQA